MKLPFCNTGLSNSERATDLVKRISSVDKLGLLLNGAAAAPSVNVSAYQWWSEALHGVAGSPGVTFAEPTSNATSFPQVQTTSMSWNKTLFHAIGEAVGIEARAFNNLGHAGLTFWTPNINIFRDPRWGRGQETPGEDPLINSMYAENFVQGFQGGEDEKHLKASACCKHFAAYSLEKFDGIDRHHFDAIVTEQDLQDTYFPAFEACVSKGKASGMMCSYNEVNGVPSCASSRLMTDLARGKWGFEGYITSDCGAVEDVQTTHNYTKSVGETINVTLSSGMDSDCGQYLSPKNLKAALDDGSVEWTTVDKALERLAKVWMRLGMFDPDASQPYKRYGVKDINTPAHQQLALSAARQGMVLLKNEKSALPFSKDATTIAAIGPLADATYVLQANYRGTAPYLISPAAGLSAYGKVSMVHGCDVACNSSSGFADAITAAKASDATVLVIGIDLSVESEGRDRTSISLPGHQRQLVEQVAKAVAGKPFALVVIGGGSLDLEFAKDLDTVPAILWTGYPGQSGGQAIAEILFGDWNPSGRLTQTIYPSSFTEKVSMLDMNMRPNTTSGYPGRTHRFYTGKTVFEFGHGLSYTSFETSWAKPPPKVAKFDAITDMLQSSDSELFEVEVKVTNTGSMAGSHVLMAMVRSPNAGRQGAPRQEMGDFEKVYLTPGESKLVTLSLKVERFALAEGYGKWAPTRGDWEVNVGGISSTVWVL